MCDCEDEAVEEAVTVAEGVTLVLGVPEPLGLCVGDGVSDWEGDPVGEAVRVSEAD